MVQLTDFGIKVKKRLLDLGQPQKWLIEQVTQKTGKFLDNGYLQKLMTGRATSACMEKIIYEILEIEEETA